MNSIRARLLVTLLIGLALVLFIGGAAIYLVARLGLTRQFDDGLLSRARTIAALVKREPDQLVFESGDAPTATIDEIWFELRTARGETLKRSANVAGFAMPARRVADGEAKLEPLELPGAVRGRAISLGFRPRVDPDDWQGHDMNETAAEFMVVTVAMNAQSLNATLRVLWMSLLGVGAAVALAAGLLITFGVRWAIGPLERLSRRIAGVSGARLSQRLDAEDPPRELAPVYAEVNALLDRVERTLTRERTFIDAAAHELRTPLAELRSATDVALLWPDPQRAAATLREAQDIGRDMERLVESLLQISRAHARAAVREGTSFSRNIALVRVAPIIEQCLAQASDRLREKGLWTEVDVGENVEAPLPAELREAVEIVLRNLIDNAVNYTAADGSVAVRCQEADRAVVVENGPVALRDEDLPRLFEPFWRQDGARSDRGHAGLGLTVARNIAVSCGLRVDAELRGDRLRMRVAWPEVPAGPTRNDSLPATAGSVRSAATSARD